MQLIQLTESNKEQYNHFVATQESGSFLQSWDWGQWQEELGRKAHRFAIVGNEGDLRNQNWRGCVQFIKMPLIGDKYYLYAPYGPVINAGENFQFLFNNFQLLQKELRKKFSDAILIRIEPKYKSLPTTYYPLLTKSTNIQPGRTLILDLQKPDDQLLAEMHPKTRYNIKVAQRHGVEVEREFDLTVGHGLFFDEAINLIVDTAKRQEYHTHPRQYYEKLINFFALTHRGGQLQVSLYKAKYQNKVLASAVCVDFGPTRTYLFGGSSDEQRNVMAPYLLHWQAMTDAKQLGILFYDFDGLETSVGKQAQFARFKQGFGGEIVEYAGVYDIVFNRLWYTVYRMVRKINRLLK